MAQTPTVAGKHRTYACDLCDRSISFRDHVVSDAHLFAHRTCWLAWKQSNPAPRTSCTGESKCRTCLLA